MVQNLKIGYFAHWFRPPYEFAEFLKAEGVAAEEINFRKKGYFEGFDVVIVEQNGFNDYLENDELYVQDWVKRGGILLFMHQDYQRWAPYFLPHELGYIQLIHRYVDTINCCAADPTFTNDNSSYKLYMMPWIESAGERLFREPEVITPDEMIDWKIDVNSFGILKEKPNTEFVRSAAQSCYLANDKWEILGSYMDPAVKEGALILKANYGRGMYFLNQLLFPEVLNESSGRCIAFWKKYIKNLIAYFERFKNGESEKLPKKQLELPIKKNYKTAIHMHSLDWYGADSQPGTINAMMRYMDFDICSLAVKDNAPYDGKLDVGKYSDDKVLFLDGQEYHPFNFNDKYCAISENTYHFLAIGIDNDAYTQKFTCSRFSDEDVAKGLREAVEYVHSHGGAICATHPNADYWCDYDVDAVDLEPLRPASGTDIEKYWLRGNKKTLMVSVDLFGFRRILDNPAANFIYLKGEKPSRDSVVKAIKAGNVIAATGFSEADICIGDILPGDEISKSDAENSALSVCAKVMRHEIKKLRVFSADKLIYEKSDINSPKIDIKLPLKGYSLDKYIRVEVEGFNEHWICSSTPFYLK